MTLQLQSLAMPVFGYPSEGFRSHPRFHNLLISNANFNLFPIIPLQPAPARLSLKHSAFSLGHRLDLLGFGRIGLFSGATPPCHASHLRLRISKIAIRKLHVKDRPHARTTWHTPTRRY